MPFFGKKNKNRISSNRAVQKEPKRSVQWKGVILALFALIAIFAFFYFLLFSPSLRVREIKIVGNQIISSEDIQGFLDGLLNGKIWRIFPANQMAVISDLSVSEKVRNQFPQVDKIKIEKIFPRTLKIELSERSLAAIWCRTEAVAEITATPVPEIATSSPVSASTTVIQKKKEIPSAGDCFLADSEGILYRESVEISTSLFPKFFGRAGEEFGLGQQAVSSSTIAFAKEFKKEMADLGADVLGFSFNDVQRREMVAFVSEGWVIYLDCLKPAKTQARVVQALLENELKGSRQNLWYIDLRIPNRAYYK